MEEEEEEGRLISGCRPFATRTFRAAPSGVAARAAGAGVSCGLPSLTLDWRLRIDLPVPCRHRGVPPGGEAWDGSDFGRRTFSCQGPANCARGPVFLAFGAGGVGCTTTPT